jgi:hypothetical protein
VSGAELDLDAIEARAIALYAFVNEDGDMLPEDPDGLLEVLGKTEQMAHGVACDIPALVARVRRLEETLRYFRDSYDCDEDSHRYDTTCRVCESKRVLAEP